MILTTLPPTHNSPANNADLETLLGAFREFITSLSGAFLASAATFELILPNSEPNSLGFSRDSTIAGAICATVIASGLSYINFELDRQHQKSVDYTQLHSLTSLDDNTPKVTPTIYQHLRAFITNSERITPAQAFMIAVAMIGIAQDFVGFIVDVLDIEMRKSLGKSGLLGLNLLFLAMGLVAAWPEARAAKNSMEFQYDTARKTTTENPNQTADGYTLFSRFVKTLQTGADSLIFLALIIDKVAKFEADTNIDVSIRGLLYASPLSLFITYGVVFYQNHINLNYQGHFRTPTINNNNNDNDNDTEACDFTDEDDNAVTNTDTSMRVFFKSIGILDDPKNSHASRFEKFLILGRMQGTAIDFIAPLLFLLRNVLSRTAFLTLAFTGFAIGMCLTTSDKRKAENNLKNYRTFNASSDNTSSESSSWMPCSSALWCCPRDNNSANKRLLSSDSSNSSLEDGLLEGASNDAEHIIQQASDDRSNTGSPVR